MSLLEVCAYNIQSCRIAEQAGAGRIELCADPSVGGTTPSYGLIAYALEHIKIPVFPMIRPRGYGFIYDDDELLIMKKDILACRDLGCQGIATGIALNSGRLDIENLKRLVDWAYPMAVTCHKVFDTTPDAFDALEDVISTGCTRVLTSGLRKTADNGADTLAQLVVHAAGRIIIMPGGGVRSANIFRLLCDTGATEYHSSGITQKENGYIADLDEISSLVNQLRNPRPPAF